MLLICLILANVFFFLGGGDMPYGCSLLEGGWDTDVGMSSQPGGSLLRTHWLAKPAGKNCLKSEFDEFILIKKCFSYF